MPRGRPRAGPAACSARFLDPIVAHDAVSHEVRKTVTVVFADVTGSTGLGERLDPESVRRIMIRYFDEMPSSSATTARWRSSSATP